MENVDVAVEKKLCPPFCQMISGGLSPIFVKSPSFNPYVGLHGFGMTLRTRNASPCGRATMSPQSTYHGCRSGPTLWPWFSGGFPACHGAESKRIAPRSKEKKMPISQKKAHMYIVKQGSPSGFV